MWRQLLRFGLVGTSSTVVHIVIGTILIQSGSPPLIANAFAFATAFLVSFVCHLGYSFADQEPEPARALWRFGLIAVGGFLGNEAFLAVSLAMQLLPHMAALGVSTTCAASLTFCLSRHRSFRQEYGSYEARRQGASRELL